MNDLESTALLPSASPLEDTRTPTTTTISFLKSHLDDLKFLFCILIGIVFYLLPPPSGLSSSASDTFAIFIATMLAVMTTSYEMSAIVGLALVLLVFGQSLECETADGFVECRDCGDDCQPYKAGFETALTGFANPIVWMIFSAFHLGKAVEVTKLGKRISLVLMSTMGSKLTGLGTAVFLSELILAPFVPSNTARGGGIVLPIVTSLITSLKSSPSSNSSMGKYLILCGAHANLLISSFFITAAAPNPIVVAMAETILGIKVTFTTWTLGAIVPGIICMLILPIAFYKLYEYEYDGESVVEESEKQLVEIGSLTFQELKLVIILGVSLSLWVTGDYTNIPESFVAFMALLTLVFSQTLSWNDVLSNTKAWDTFFWLSGMLVMAEQLSKLGISAYIGLHAASATTYLTNTPIISLLLLNLFYFTSMVLFSSITGHTVALLSPFLSAAKTLSVPPYTSTLILGYSSSLSACLTPFSTGSVVLYYSQGFVEMKEWIGIGFGVGILYLVVYSTVGLVWWTLLGYY